MPTRETVMELLVLFVILALLFFGPRRGGRAPGPAAIAFGIFFLVWFVLALTFGWTWQTLIGPIAQP